MNSGKIIRIKSVIGTGIILDSNIKYNTEDYSKQIILNCYIKINK